MILNMAVAAASMVASPTSITVDADEGAEYSLPARVSQSPGFMESIVVKRAPDNRGSMFFSKVGPFLDTERYSTPAVSIDQYL
jgi:hypothetical protein